MATTVNCDRIYTVCGGCERFSSCSQTKFKDILVTNETNFVAYSQTR